MAAMVGGSVGVRSWTLAIPAPVPMRSANDEGNLWDAARCRREWREAAYVWAVQAKVPKGLSRIRVQVELRFTAVRRRDAGNYGVSIVKPIVDALGPARQVRRKNGQTRVEVGRGVIPDDTAAHLELPEPRIGDPVPQGLHRYGLVLVTITDLSEEPA